MGIAGLGIPPDGKSRRVSALRRKVLGAGEWLAGAARPRAALHHMARVWLQLRDALGDRPVDIPMRVQFGFYPRYRLLVTYFIERKGWSIDQLLQTRLTEDEATEIMRADEKR